MSDSDADGIGADTTLLLDPTADQEDGQYCRSGLDVGPPAQRAELRVSFTESETERIGVATAGGRQPAKRGIVSVGDSLQATGTGGEPDYDAPVAFAPVTDPSALQELGQTIADFCEAWAGEGLRIAVCFDSLTDLLEHAPPGHVVEFVRTLGACFALTDAVGHFHVDPGAHPEAVLSELADAADAVVHEAAPDRSDPRLRTTDSEVAERIAAGTDTDGQDRTGSAPSEEGSDRPIGDTGDAPSEASDDDIAEALED